MIRFVVGAGGVVVPDLAGRLPGRGMWLSARADVLQAAQRRGVFARAAGGAVSVPADLSLVVRAGLERRIGELLGLARRAGQAVTGFQKARDWLLHGRAALMIEASDGSPEERARALSGGPAVPVVTALPASAVGRVFGRDHVVHVAVAPGRLADAIKLEAERLAGIAGAAAPEDRGEDAPSVSAGGAGPRPAIAPRMANRD